MREVKFRGKSHHSSEWVYGTFDYIFRKDIRSGVSERRSDIGRITLPDGSYAEVDCETLGEFTGVKDKNGCEIYEGDIVECVSWNEFFSDKTTGNVLEPFRRRMRVAFVNGAFKMIEPFPYPVSDNVWDLIFNGDIVVIGNVFDNKELLKSVNVI